MSTTIAKKPSAEDEDELISNAAIIIKRYNDRVSTLPKHKGWITDYLYKYQGFWYPSKLFVELVMASQDDFQAQPDDIYLASHPKSGTTWLKALAFAITNRIKFSHPDTGCTHPLRTTSPHLCVPCIEVEICESTPCYAEGQSPRLFSTHVPYGSLPESIIRSGCRIVYVCRNPKDVFVSWFYFMDKLRHKSRPPITLEDAFELFTKGVVPFGPCWDHVVGYRQESFKQPGRILFLTYEEIQENTQNNVKKLAEFLGFPFTLEEEREGVVQEIIELCSFEKLSEANKHGFITENISDSIYFREGKVGDSSKHLSLEMMQILDHISEEKFRGLDLSYPSNFV